MPNTIDAGFADLLASLRAGRVETTIASGHRASIEGKLKAAFTMTSFLRSGSFGNLHIQSTNTVFQTLDAIDALERAYRWATDAVELNHAGRTAAAFDRWRLVFNNGFPRYSP